MRPRNRVGIGLSYRPAIAEISKQSMGEGQEPSRNKVFVLARQATQPGGIGSLESILGSLRSLNIWHRLHSLAELVPLNRFLGLLKSKTNSGSDLTLQHGRRAGRVECGSDAGWQNGRGWRLDGQDVSALQRIKRGFFVNINYIKGTQEWEFCWLRFWIYLSSWIKLRSLAKYAFLCRWQRKQIIPREM